MNLENIFGIHSTFYYYGKEHLFVNLINYIKVGVENNEIVFISMEEDMHESLKDALGNAGIDKESVEFVSVNGLIDLHKQEGLYGLKRELNILIEDYQSKGYDGVRWIGEPAYAIQLTSREDFLNFEDDLSKAFRNTKASILCIYDTYDCLTKSQCTDKELIEKSKYTHTHILKGLQLEKLG